VQLEDVVREANDMPKRGTKQDYSEYNSEGRVSDGLATADTEVKRLEEEASQGPVERTPGLFGRATQADPIPQTTVAITSIWPGRLVLTGPSGTRYEWASPGTKLLVATDDVEFIMAKNRIKNDPCCGNFAARTYFVME